jgi:hypothetical protein
VLFHCLAELALVRTHEPLGVFCCQVVIAFVCYNPTCCMHNIIWSKVFVAELLVSPIT